MTHERLDICKEIQERMKQHMDEGVLVRDRLRMVEVKIELLEKAVMKNAIIGGLIGALIGSGAAPAVNHLVELFIKLY
jgi:hypothetical protein